MLFSLPWTLTFPFVSQFTSYITVKFHTEQYLLREAFVHFPNQGCVCVCVFVRVCMYLYVSVSRAHTHTIVSSFIMLCKHLPFIVLNTIAILPWFAWVVAKIFIDIKLHEDKVHVSFCLILFFQYLDMWVNVLSRSLGFIPRKNKEPLEALWKIGVMMTNTKIWALERSTRGYSWVKERETRARKIH